ncbi:unnamed protein product [Phaeothamnion confervicola]
MSFKRERRPRWRRVRESAVGVLALSQGNTGFIAPPVRSTCPLRRLGGGENARNAPSERAGRTSTRGTQQPSAPTGDAAVELAADPAINSKPAAAAVAPEGAAMSLAAKRARVRAMYESARQELRQGRTREGVAILRDCLRLDDRDAHSWLLLGRTEARSGRVVEAAVVFEAATAKCPYSVHLWQAWAVLQHRRGDLDQARQLFARGLEVDPGNAYVCHAWGLLEQRADDTERARELFSAAMAKRPQAQVICALGELEASCGRLEQAREVFAGGVRVVSRDRSAIYMAWGRVEEQVAGDFERARAMLDDALKCDHDNVKVM